jgi:anaerobic magnesium-protoporphyrin IX monomethyl ester cyclase
MIYMADVLLIFPMRQEMAARLPLSIMYVAAALKKGGYAPKIIDTRIEPLSGLDDRDLIYVGITSMSGSQITHGLEVAKQIRAQRPELPIVWGGLHPSMLPEQTIENEFVDIVVRQEGEETAVELAHALKNHLPLANVKGITFKDRGKIVNTTDRAFINLDTIGNLDYGLVKLDKYLDVRDYFSYHSSRGCPHQCIFCHNQCYNKLSWRKKSSKVVVKEMRYLIEDFGIKSFVFHEDNFFVSKERVREICSAIVENGWKINWTAQDRVDYFAGYDEAFISLLKESGCDHIFFGGESGSQKILDYVKKGITLNQTIEAVKKCKQIGITPQISFVIGWPEESWEDLCETLDFVDRLRSIHDGVEINNLFILGIFPGTPMYDIAKALGAKEYRSLEEWGSWRLDRSDLPWISKSYRLELTAVSNIVRFNFIHQKLCSTTPDVKKARLAGNSIVVVAYEILHYIFNISARYRWQRRWFKHPYEWLLWGFVKDKFIQMV